MSDQSNTFDRRTFLQASGIATSSTLIGEAAARPESTSAEEIEGGDPEALLARADEKFPGGIVSVYAKELTEDGNVLARHEADKAVKPASNVKLVASTLALKHLGPDYRFKTTVRSNGESKGSQLHGDLILYGTGAILSESDLERLATDVVETGVKGIHGDIVVDISAFETDGYGPIFSVRGPGYPEGWTWEDPQYSYGAPSSALALNWNKVSITAKHTDKGLNLSISPNSSVVNVESHISAVSEGEDGYFYTYLDRVNNTIHAIGELPPGYEETELAPVMRPDKHCGKVFAQALKTRNVKVKGDVVLRTKATGTSQSVFESSIRSAPLREILGPMLKNSNNVTADQLALATARAAADQGSFNTWTDIANAYFKSLGTNATMLRDGSGLSQFNLLSARNIVSLLQWVAHKPWSSALFESLATPGEGTLTYRLDNVDVPVQAKTGTVRGTRALSGIIRRPNDADVAFSILMSNMTVGLDEARAYQDRLVEAFVNA
ncbi:D-alanyl-D-alanine carboxypeptidase/D-alanyl-D-alanine endopeptidase [Halococcus agarilyticus]|uniref:D-alanyl-D-alanine carboxypeptidase/D-alanyl-D-alanine endopeptidase n=1 Tax=Halococcus agarilyticus TaxID=1232219 RepID=UPI00067777E1|nr:D-alanyl-D-alanine carboxypeptidase/D-alanyl-D-alanine-endopeptidase [Halococcus agarilyticus]